MMQIYTILKQIKYYNILIIKFTIFNTTWYNKVLSDTLKLTEGDMKSKIMGYLAFREEPQRWYGEKFFSSKCSQINIVSTASRKN